MSVTHAGSTTRSRIPMNPGATRVATAGLVALVGAAALDITGRFAEVGPARFTVYQLLAFAIALLAVWVLTSRRAEWPASPLDLPLAAFLATAALSVAFATERAPAIVQLASLASSVILVVLVALFVRSPRQGAVVVASVLAVAAIYGVLALLEWRGIFAVQHPVFYTPGYGIRARVTFLDPNILASFLMSSILLATPLMLVAPMKRGVRAAGLAAIAVALTGLATTYSRGGLGGLVIGLIAVASLVRAPRRARVAFVAVMVAVIALAGVLVLDARWISENVIAAGETGSATNRVYMVEGALKMWRDHPFGVGLDNYQIVYPEYRDPRAEAGIVESHVAYVTVLVETGFLGLIAFLWVLGAFFFRIALPTVRSARGPTLHALAVGAFASALALSAQAFTYSIEASKFWWFAIGVGLAVWRMARVGAAESADARPLPAEGESSLT